MAPKRWLPIPGRPSYQISDHGDVIGARGPIAQATTPRGYRAVHLSTAGKNERRFVHCLVLLAFVGPRPADQFCRHLNGNPADNRLENLKWGTLRENYEDQRRHGTAAIGERHGMATMTAEVVREARRLKASGKPRWGLTALARAYGVDLQSLSRAVNGKSWRHLR